MDSLLGGIGLPQLVQVTRDNAVVLSVIIYISCGLNCKGSVYRLCLELGLKLIFETLSIRKFIKKVSCLFYFVVGFGRRLQRSCSENSS